MALAAGIGVRENRQSKPEQATPRSYAVKAHRTPRRIIPGGGFYFAEIAFSRLTDYGSFPYNYLNERGRAPPEEDEPR